MTKLTPIGEPFVRIVSKPSQIASAWTVLWLLRMLCVDVLGTQSSSASSLTSLLNGGCIQLRNKAHPNPSFIEDRTYKLLIVDSIMNLFSSCGKRNSRLTADTAQDKTTAAEGSLAKGNRFALALDRTEAHNPKKLNQFLNKLQKMAEEFNIAIVLTNQVRVTLSKVL